MLTLICALSLAFASEVPNTNATSVHGSTATHFDEVDDLIASGRRALDEGRLEEAEKAFDAAAAKDEARGQIWQLRAQLSRGSVEEVLGRLSTLRRQGRKDADMTYLWGVAFATKVELDLATGNTGNTGLMIKDARSELEAACAADATRYRDAHLLLARMCRHDGDHAASVVAAKRAVEFYPKSIEAQELIGRGALAQYAAVSADEERKAEADALMAEAVGAFQRAIELVGRPRGGGEQALVAALQSQLGDAHAFGKKNKEAIEAYAAAIGWEPAGFDYSRTYNVLGVDDMVKCLELGRAEFAKRTTNTDARMATLDWWLGYALFASKDPARNMDGEKAFANSMRLWPAYANGWYYTARLRYDRQDMPGALAALRELSVRSRAELIALVRADSSDVTRIFGIIEHCMRKAPPQFEDAAFLSEIQAEAFPDQDSYWNNAGLFWRDAADMHVGRKGRTGMNEAERARFMPMYERSWECYSKARELVPQSPVYLNDGAVILHFYLERDYDTALAMYADAARLARELVDGGTLEGQDLVDVQVALRDSMNNRRLLEQKIAAEKRRENEKKDAVQREPGA